MRIHESTVWLLLKPIFTLIVFFASFLTHSEDLVAKAEHAFYTGDLIAAKKYYAELAETENSNAHYYLGLINKMSDEQQRDRANMLAHFKKAASLGHDLAMWELGVAYEAGDGVDQNQYIAMDWFRKSEQHSTLSDETIFFVNEPDGTLTEYQPAEYFEYLLMKAQAGDTDAQFSVAALYDKGQLTTLDQNAALKWYLAAAQSGHARAAAIASYFYCRGVVGDIDPVKAQYWAEKSSLNTKCEH
ncbi:tetratricopeptide repeat protein [Arsukibacterium sp.]|uniref:tetratricopeptide repeat protein n=1 Tax=Arsukibacterium sp. TaxID=1977258 RepID=UPI0035684BF2